MARGLASGMIWGALTSAMGAGALSLAVGLPSAPDRMDAAPAPVAMPAPAPDTVNPETPAALAGGGTISEQSSAPAAAPIPPPRASAAPVTAAPAVPGTVEAAPAAPQATTETAPQPQVAAPVTAPEITLPTSSDITPGIVTASREAATAGGETGQAAAPAALVAPPVETGQPVPATASQPAAAPEPAAVPEPVVPPAVAAATPETAAARPETAAITPETITPGAVEQPGSAADDPVTDDMSPAAEADEVPQTAPQSAPEPARIITGLPQARTQGVPAIGTPATPLTERDRPAVTAGPKAIDTHAAAFANPDNKPRMAIVLIDRGDSPVGLEALRAFPYPLSFAVDPSRKDATAAMARYRAAGFEVLALADLPEAATAPDVEQALAAILATLPETVAVMEGDRSGVQTTREAADQVTAMLAASGHGAVFMPKGLDTARKLAEKAGVPAATIFRDFDGAAQDPGTIRRFLDQAAFKAAQDGPGVIMLGRLRPETISALLLWGLQDRTERISLAPVSAVLRGE